MSILRYTLIRVALVAAFAGLFYLVGMRSYLLAFAAIICGAMAGYIFFPRAGQDAAGSIENLVSRRQRAAKRPVSVDEEAEDRLFDEEN